MIDACALVLTAAAPAAAAARDTSRETGVAITAAVVKEDTAAK